MEKPKGKTIMITTIHNHGNSDGIVPDSFVEELRLILEQYNKRLGLYKISDFKKYILPAIHKNGWSQEYCLDRVSKITITSIKEKIGLCIQTGNMARTYADLLKLQALFSKGIITGGILIVATSNCGRSFGGNIASYERIIKELSIFYQVITIPLVIIGFDNDLS